MRPWEYYNEAAGGTAGGYRYFSDEGVDLGQRTKELVNYYNTDLKPNGEVPYVLYFSSDIEFEQRGLDWVGKDPERDKAKMSGETRTGTFIMGSRPLAPTLFWDNGAIFRNVEPVRRFGNLFVYRGTFPASASTRAAFLFYDAIGKIYSPEHDVQGGIDLMLQSAEVDPSPFFVWLELGNQYLALGNREESLRTYKASLEHAPKSDGVYRLLEDQIRKVETEPLEGIAPLRNPGAE
jgi:tetratricopeptide (TPR) repeat protein